MLGRAVAVGLLMVSGVLAGCIGNTDEPTDVTPSTTDTGNPLNMTAAPDGRGQISAFNETNKTETTGTGSMMHQHDYWRGKERLDIGYIDAGLIPFPLAPCKRSDGACSAGSTSPSTGDSGDTYPAGTAIADFLMTPLDPTIFLIPEGTKQVEFKLVRFDGLDQVGEPAPRPPANPAGKVFFDYLAANDEPGKFRKGSELKLNTPVAVDIKPTDADMPHQTKSLWIYRIYSNTEMLAFEFNITITAIRGYDVVNWPPHPDLYANSPTRTIFDGPVKLSSKGTIDSNVFGSDAGWVHPEKVISWGTDSLDIEFTNVKINTQAPLPPSSWLFEYNNASKPPLLGNGAQYSARMKDSGSDGTTYRFTIDLKSDNGAAYDTPYAQYSRWGFRLMPQFDQAAGACLDQSNWPAPPPAPNFGRFIQQFLVGCQVVPWEATYQLKIVAHGHSTAEGVPAGAS